MGRLRRNVEYEKKLYADTIYYVNNPSIHKGTWKNVFNNDNPIEIEIGSGKGRFIFEKALKNPDINFIAIDKFATVLYKLLSKLNSLQEPIKNIKIITLDVKKVSDVFSQNEISKIYLNFCDPWPKKHHEKFRLTSNFYTKMFFDILVQNGIIEFKTDNTNLFNYTLNKIRENKYKVYFAISDLYATEYKKKNVVTEYEQKWVIKGSKIKKIIFSK